VGDEKSESIFFSVFGGLKGHFLLIEVWGDQK
jgi:hypothetical protein